MLLTTPSSVCKLPPVRTSLAWGFFRRRSINYGHVPPLLIAGDSREATRYVEDSSLPVGFFGEALYTSAHLRIKPGDRFLAYSDGITEAAPTRQRTTTVLSLNCDSRVYPDKSRVHPEKLEAPMKLRSSGTLIFP